ncbi:MAG: LysM peptidoglycan-binding domain-containing protein, partial [Anaerolineales bacterium]|nr:LysM peptidoglycan-binding domain-containing protein [Anaerolineales bacterium]
MKRFILLMLLVGLVFGTAVSARADFTYVVQPGDTLMAIARRYGVTAVAIAQANHIVNPNLIYAGQQLIIPTAGGAPPAPAPA